LSSIRNSTQSPSQQDSSLSESPLRTRPQRLRPLTIGRKRVATHTPLPHDPTTAGLAPAPQFHSHHNSPDSRKHRSPAPYSATRFSPQEAYRCNPQSDRANSISYNPQS